MTGDAHGGGRYLDASAHHRPDDRLSANMSVTNSVTTPRERREDAPVGGRSGSGGDGTPVRHPRSVPSVAASVSQTGQDRR